MSDVIDRPMLGHNQPPETEVTDFAMLAARLTPDLLTEALEARFGAHLTRRNALMEGVRRFAAAHCDPSLLTTAAVLPGEGREGEIVWLKADEARTGTFHQRMMGRWRPLPDEQVIRLILPRVTIADAVVSRAAVSFARQLKEAVKAIERDRSMVKSVFDDAGKAVQTWFRAGIATPLDAAAREIETALSAWQTGLEAMERAAREAESRRLAEESAAVTMAAARTGHPDILDAALDAARAAERAGTRATASTADMARVRGATGGVAAAREVWTFTVTDPATVPREYLMVDEAKIREAVKRDKEKAIGAIPGVTVQREIRTSVR